jgi:FkbM family methyltransferase
MLRWFFKWSFLRRLAWRVSRRAYAGARGEPSINAIAINGEAYVQRCVARGVVADSPMRILDIGANEGEWSLSMLAALAETKRAGAARLDVFEPVPATLTRLRAALGLAPSQGFAHVHALAVSDECGREKIAVMSTTGGTNTLHPGALSDAPAGGFVEVEKTTLLRFCEREGIAHIELAKCDTEGHDLSVLRGARPLLVEGCIDVFQFEYNHRWIYARAYLKDVFDLVAGLPYCVARIMPTSIEVLPAWHPELERFFEANYLLVHDRAIRWFDARVGAFDMSNTYA